MGIVLSKFKASTYSTTSGKSPQHRLPFHSPLHVPATPEKWSSIRPSSLRGTI